MNKDAILKAAAWRSAIRKFTDQKISDDDWQFLLEIARLSPSSYGYEPWNILALQNKEIREAIKPYSWGACLPAQLDTASHFVIFTVKTDLKSDSKYFDHIITDIMKDDNLDEWHQDFARFAEKDFDLTDDRKRHDWAAKQAYIAMANMMLAAALIGIDSCPIEGFNIQQVEKVLSAKEILDLSQDRLAVMAAFGYRDGEPDHAKVRCDLSEIVREIK